MKGAVGMGKGNEQSIVLNDLLSKLTLIDMKKRIVQTMCSLMGDELYTKDDAVRDLMEVVVMIEMEEKAVDRGVVRDGLEVGG